jgi:CHRD domain-containing protein
MKRASLAVAFAFLVAGCGSSSTAPSAAANPTFNMALLPANETPPITNAEAGSSGNVTITFVTTKDASGNITAATATAVVTLQGFPAGSTITNAHIHTGATGVAGGVLVPFPPGTVTLTNGSGTFTAAANPPPTAAQATSILANPQGFYFNVHTALNGGGVMRGQLVRTQ